LQIRLRIPITIEQDNDVGRHEIDTQTTRTSREQKDELVASRLVVFVNGPCSRIVIGATVDTAVFETPEQTIVLQNIQHATHLREDEDSRALFFHVLEELVENDHLAGIVNQVFVRGVGWSGFLSDREELVVTLLQSGKVHTAPSKTEGEAK
jgi:hypothetical protein